MWLFLAESDGKGRAAKKSIVNLENFQHCTVHAQYSVLNVAKTCGFSEMQPTKITYIRI
jgi:hypothetical protein